MRRSQDLRPCWSRWFSQERRTLDELGRRRRRVTATLGSLRSDAGQSLESLNGAVHRALDEIGGVIGDVRQSLKE